ncbi:MAG: energy transducer TonB [Candidatus Thiodiazotropha sp.]
MRLLLGLSLALLINLALFWLLETMLREKEVALQTTPAMDLVNFVRLAKAPESVDQPPPREQPRQEPPPPAPRTPLEPVRALNPPRQDWSMPDLDLPLKLSGGPFLGSRPEIPATLAAEPVPRMRFPPRYPQRALMRRLEGKVILEFTINPDGSVSDARVVEAHPPGYFEQSALRAIARWQFHPRIVAGNPVSRTARQTISYTLKQ